MIAQNSAITKIHLNDSNLSSESLESIIDALKENCILEDLDLTGNDTNVENGSKLADVLKSFNTTITSINIDQTPFFTRRSGKNTIL